MQKHWIIIVVSAVLFSSCTETSRITEHKEWAKHFEAPGITNPCFLLRDNNHEAIHYLNKERCTERLLPASTFKIFNSLVALETAVAPDDQLLIKWDSVATREDCSKDLTMRDAFKASCLWYYQEIARRVGAAKMQHYLDTVKYGNMKMAGKIDDFWLTDSLQISADEQAGFVKRLYFAELPFSERSQRIVKGMMLQEETPGYRLYYKTGTGKHKGNYVYWVVGFAERIVNVKEPKGSMNKSNVRNYPYFFAQNFEVKIEDTSKDWFKERIRIVHEVLKEYGAIPKEG